MESSQGSWHGEASLLLWRSECVGLEREKHRTEKLIGSLLSTLSISSGKSNGCLNFSWLPFPICQKKNMTN